MPAQSSYRLMKKRKSVFPAIIRSRRNLNYMLREKMVTFVLSESVFAVRNCFTFCSISPIQ